MICIRLCHNASRAMATAVAEAVVNEAKALGKLPFLAECTCCGGWVPRGALTPLVCS
jgi:hypothetical protein